MSDGASQRTLFVPQPVATKRPHDETHISFSLPSVPVSPLLKDEVPRHASLPQPLRVFSPTVSRATNFGSFSHLKGPHSLPPASIGYDCAANPQKIIPFMQVYYCYHSNFKFFTISSFTPDPQISSNEEPEPPLATWRASDAKILSFNERFLQRLHLAEDQVRPKLINALMHRRFSWSVAF